MNRQEKEAMVAELAGKARSSQAMLVADYRGLTVAEARELRTEMRAAGADYQVIKNTLMILAADAAELPEMKQYLEGPSAIAFCEGEAVAPAKVLMKYVKEFKPLEVKGGVLEGQMIDADKIKFLASLPPREVLIAQLLGGLQGPIRGLATVCAGPIRGLVTALQRIQEQKEAEAA
ncbi:MAG: 50S ribosomal protein L10 [Gaiellales bacterium]|nr:MAG: 50S ribosomal protein L10 [Gaiellales bacterium]